MTKQQLPAPIRLLVEQCQDIGYGEIAFHVRRGEPDFSQPYCFTQTIKLTAGQNGPRREAQLSDFTLRKHHVALVTALNSMRDGARVTLEVKAGLPFVVRVESQVA